MRILFAKSHSSYFEGLPPIVYSGILFAAQRVTELHASFVVGGVVDSRNVFTRFKIKQRVERFKGVFYLFIKVLY
jgi:hypothetical protein